MDAEDVQTLGRQRTRPLKDSRNTHPSLKILPSCLVYLYLMGFSGDPFCEVEQPAEERSAWDHHSTREIEGAEQ